MSMNLNNIAILNIKSADYCWFISGISKSEAKNRFDQKNWNFIKHKNFFISYKIGKEILTFGDFEIEKNKFYRH